MRKIAFLMIALLLGAVGSAFADGVTYDITVNTSSLTGTSGSLDFQFDPGPYTTQAATMTIQNFSSDGTLGTGATGPVTTGDASGALPGVVSFDNGTSYNDYFTGFTYGTTLSFSVNLTGPAVTSPDGTSNSGSEFVFSMFGDSAGTVPVLTNDTTDGFAVILSIAPGLTGGTTSATSLSDQSGVTQESSPTPAPEPGSAILLSIAVLGAAALKRLLAS